MLNREVRVEKGDKHNTCDWQMISVEGKDGIVQRD